MELARDILLSRFQWAKLPRVSSFDGLMVGRCLAELSVPRNLAMQGNLWLVASTYRVNGSHAPTASLAIARCRDNAYHRIMGDQSAWRASLSASVHITTVEMN